MNKALLALLTVLAGAAALAACHANARHAAIRNELTSLSRALTAQGELVARLQTRLARESAARQQLAAALRTPGGPAAARGTPPAVAAARPTREHAPPASATGLSASEEETIRRQVRRVQGERVMQSWRYRRQAYLENPEGFTLSVLNPLRAGLGDEVYERYLRAEGRAAAVSVSGIVEASSAASAGLRAGDLITHYDGQRVFHLNELLALSVQGEPGTWVEVQVLRGEQVIYVMLERGPLGVTAHHGRG